MLLKVVVPFFSSKYKVSNKIVLTEGCKLINDFKCAKIFSSFFNFIKELKIPIDPSQLVDVSIFTSIIIHCKVNTPFHWNTPTSATLLRSLQNLVRSWLNILSLKRCSAFLRFSFITFLWNFFCSSQKRKVRWRK